MDDLIKLFDSLLILTVSFPITIFQFLVSPDRVIGAGTSDLISPPGATLVISVIVWRLASSLKDKIRDGSFEFFAFLQKETALPFFAFITLVLTGQSLLLSVFSTITKQPVDVITIIKALSYPLSVSLTIGSFVYILYIFFPVGSNPDGLTLEERYSNVARQIRMENQRKRIVVLENAVSLETLSYTLVYIFSLFNVIRILFHLNYTQAIMPTLVLAVVTFVLVLLSIMKLMNVGKYIEKLRSQEKVIPSGEGSKE
jgi:hypothetical protein